MVGKKSCHGLNLWLGEKIPRWKILVRKKVTTVVTFGWEKSYHGGNFWLGKKVTMVGTFGWEKSYHGTFGWEKSYHGGNCCLGEKLQWW